jgi:hypothetical protein
MADETPDSDVLDHLSAWVGLIPTVLAGGFGVLGLKNEEVGTVLRNNPVAPTIVVALLLGAVLTGLAASTLPKLTIRLSVAAGLLLLATSSLPLLAWAVPVNVDARGKASLAMFIVLIAAALMCIGFRARGPGRLAKRVSTRPLALAVSIVLLTAAVFSGVRVEARSQAKSTTPQVNVSLPRSQGEQSLDLSVSAERITANEQVVVRVDGRVAAAARNPTKSCDVTDTDCLFVGGFFFYPDSSGRVEGKITMPIDAGGIQHLSIRTKICRGVVIGDPACSALNGIVTLLDFELPTGQAT